MFVSEAILLIRLYNARIMPMLGENDCSILEGELWTDGERISYVGPARADMPEFDRELDLGGDLIIPGFKDAHTHIPMVFLRSFADGLPLQEWLFQQIFPREAKLYPEANYAFTRLGILELLSGGVTACFDMYYHRDAYVQAVLDSGFRSVLCGAVAAGDADWTVAERDFERYNSMGPLVGYRLGFHAEYTASEEPLRYISELSHAHKAPVWTHNSETKSEYDGCIERHGMSPTRYFEKLGLHDYGGGGFHCVWFDEGDMEIFKNRGLWAVTCPASNAKLASGVAPLGSFMDRGIGLAVGTDGPSSNNALDMFREMYLACVLQKLRAEDAAACPARDILYAACSAGARAMGLPDCDSLAPGKYADLAVIDMSRPSMRPIIAPAENLVYSGSKDCVRLTMVAGRILYENGEFHVGESAERIIAEAEKYTRELTA
ncbi:MAG TPA: amidohydrolase [Candidatus Scatomorpha pullistercoris]|uniref:Amidohydrolase n=1 Tax=Candidatus Scatomorpha pullistercoris TaxID=2840929 RepID=A0A9D1G5P7_9FIRM|nr:amidohydrolase [Candidatus Scatomorpha pullistercoris]